MGLLLTLPRLVAEWTKNRVMTPPGVDKRLLAPVGADAYAVRGMG